MPFAARLVVILALALTAACAGGPARPPMDAMDAGYAPAPPYRAEAVVATARQQLGARYRAGGCTPHEGFDCSGFVQYVYGRNGLSLPRSTSDLLSVGVEPDARGLLAGDLVFFRIGRLGSTLHVGIYTGRGQFIHSPSSGGRVREEPIRGAYWLERYIGARRLLPS